MILFCIRKEGDLDNFTPIIFGLSKRYKNNICIVCTEPAINYEYDFRIKFLVKNPNVVYKNFNEIFEFNLFQKLLYFLIFIKNFKQYFKILKFEKYNLIDFFFNNTKIKKDYYKMKIVVIDHVQYKKIFFLKKLLNYKKKIKFKLLSFPHGIPLLNEHNNKWDNAKKDIVNISKNVDKIILQHVNWHNELKKHEINNNFKILGSPRFSHSWSKIYDEIIPNSKLSNHTSKINIVYMSANSDSHIDYIEKKISLVNYLVSSPKINLLYKAHPRTNNFYSVKIPNLQNVNNINSRSLINWADIVIGDISSIMIDALLLNKLYISPSFLRFKENKLLFEDYGACLEIDKFERLTNFIDNIQIENKKTILISEVNKYEKNKIKFLNEIVFNNSKNVVQDYLNLIFKYV